MNDKFYDKHEWRKNIPYGTRQTSLQVEKGLEEGFISSLEYTKNQEYEEAEDFNKKLDHTVRMMTDKNYKYFHWFKKALPYLIIIAILVFWFSDYSSIINYPYN